MDLFGNVIQYRICRIF